MPNTMTSAVIICLSVVSRERSVAMELTWLCEGHLSGWELLSSVRVQEGHQQAPLFGSWVKH